MRVLLCSDRWGRLSATEVVAALVTGWRSRRPEAEVVGLPFSSGGAGFVPSLAAATGLPVEEVWRLRDGSTDYLDGALLTSDGDSRRLGAALADSIGDGARRVVVGLGDAAGVDGGAGLLRTLGESEELETALPRAAERTRDVAMVAAYREETPLLGLKGASAAAIETLGWSRQQAQDHEGRMGEYVDRVRRILPPRKDLLTGKVHRLDLDAGGGAGGGAGFALATLGARLTPGADVFADSVDLAGQVARANLVVVGTNVFDWRSMAADTVATVIHAAADAAKPSVVLAEHSEVGRRELMSLGASAAYSIVDPRSLRRRDEADLSTELTALARRVAGTWSAA